MGEVIYCFLWVFGNMGVIHIEMHKILVAVKMWALTRHGKRITIECDNKALVPVLKMERQVSWLL